MGSIMVLVGFFQSWVCDHQLTSDKKGPFALSLLAYMQSIEDEENIGDASDDSNLMGYSSGDSCFSFPHAMLMKLAEASVLDGRQLQPGKVVSITLKAIWSNPPQVSEQWLHS